MINTTQIRLDNEYEPEIMIELIEILHKLDIRLEKLEKSLFFQKITNED